MGILSHLVVSCNSLYLILVFCRLLLHNSPMLLILAFQLDSARRTYFLNFAFEDFNLFRQLLIQMGFCSYLLRQIVHTVS